MAYLLQIKSYRVSVKIIKDKIPQMIRDNGCTVHDHELEGATLNTALKNKIIEEAHEVVETKSIEALKEELADLLEVISTIMSINNIDSDEIAKIRSAKNEERGSFSRGIYVSTIEIDEENPTIKYYQTRSAQDPEKITKQ